MNFHFQFISQLGSVTLCPFYTQPDMVIVSVAIPFKPQFQAAAGQVGKYQKLKPVSCESHETDSSFDLYGFLVIHQEACY